MNRSIMIPIVMTRIMIDPGRFGRPSFGLQVASACAIAISDFVQSPKDPEKSSIDVLSPRLTFVYETPSWRLFGNVLPAELAVSSRSAG